MGICCCKVKCEKHEEQKGLLEKTSKGSEEPDREKACSKKEDGGQADSNGTQDSRKLGSEAQMAVVPEMQVNQEVGSEVKNLGTAENKCPEDCSPKTEDGHTTYQSQKTNERNLEDEKTGSGHVVCPVLKIETTRVEDLPKLENLQDKTTTKKAESELSSSKSENAHRIDFSLKSESIEVADPSLKSDFEGGADPSLSSKPIKVEYPSLKGELTELEDPSLKCEPVELKDPSLKSEHIAVVQPNFNSEPVEAVDPSLKNEPVETVDPSIKNEPKEVADSSLKKQIIEVVEPTLKSQSLQSEERLPGPQDVKAEDPTPKAVDGAAVGPDTVFPDEASSLTDHKPCLGSLSRPADEEAAEMVSGTLNLEGESEHKDHASEGDVPATVKETSDVNEDNNSSSQAKKPSVIDELITRKSCTTEEEEEPEDPEAKMVVLQVVPSLQGIAQDVEEELEVEVKKVEGIGGESDEREEEGDASKTTEAGGKGKTMERNSPTETQEENASPGSPLMVQLKTEPLSSEHGITVVTEAESFEDLYRSEEDIIKDNSEHGKMEPLIQITLPGVQDRSSVAPGVNILSYGQGEWKGNTAKSALIRKGYSELSQSFEGLRRVRGDNYCALRATLFQVLSHSNKLPAWIEDGDITLLPEKLAAEMEPVESWKFPLGCIEAGEKEGAIEQLKRHLRLLQKTWRAVAKADGAEERRSLCEAMFQGGEEEHALLEAVKLLMLSSAVELHASMESGKDVPMFCLLLFARDDSDCPRTFLTNHLSHVGFSGGLEQVEMFLLGYTLQHTIQVYRLYKTDTEEFITYYPDDHKEDWPLVSLVTEDDRHYNVLVGKN
ncbi:AF4/FMR2 family member 4-like [Anguilla anguilla]|uniref:AF4/FMR2 family member 4-like n=1 Tax=Anguilla anguilla TaxID=7936 RepID=UPI0015B2326D|nr:AF4/FMR2 family member 4-like [Anguilla anguilla]